MSVDAIGGVAGAYHPLKTQAVEAPHPVSTRTVEPDAPSAEKEGELSSSEKGEKGLNKFDISDKGSNGEARIGDTSAEALKKAVEEINKNAKNSEAQFSVHEETNRLMIKIVDKDTKEVIKEFPPEKTLDMIAKAWELAGIAVDEKR